MHTQITIKHETAQALKDHLLWQLIQNLFLSEGPVSVIEIVDADDKWDD